MMFARPAASMFARRAGIASRALGACPSSYVDLNRYPINDLESPNGKQFMQRCRAEIDETGLLTLPGFLKPQAIKSFLAEEDHLHKSQQTSHVKYDHTTEFNTDLQEGEVAARIEQTEQWVVGYDQLGTSSGLKDLYHWAPVLDFVRGVLGHKVWLSEDPMNRLHMNRYAEGNAIGWHHDKSEFFFNLLLQSPTAGGQFEYVKGSLHRPNVVEAVQDDNDRSEVVAPKLRAGTVAIFRGRENMHRVTACEGAGARITSIFNFASTEGGGVLDDATRDLFFGSRELEA